ncbi:hypothetical protein PIB30_041867 [Stylosanthes scabra]|uniref:Uncharacterized protein n=1 Tax=Stylosanthes scabra TaxID=79078 RepID=A0ABU6VDC9_9FABA|nr:hypothetical protein [Stylosanthes scabra]
MAPNGPSPSVKGKGKAYGPPTRASPMLADLRSQRSQRIAAIGRTFFQAPKEQEVIIVSSDLEPEPMIGGKEEDAGMEEEEEEEDHEKDPEEENAAEEGVREEDDFANYWALVRSDSENSVGNDYHFWNYDGDLPNWGTQNQPTALLEAAQDLLQQTSRRMIAPQ